MKKKKKIGVTRTYGRVESILVEWWQDPGEGEEGGAPQRVHPVVAATVSWPESKKSKSC